MFNLIITIIAIILVAAVTGASVYYGGKAFNKSGSDADAAALINGAQQVAAAYTLAAAQSTELTSANLSDYLSEVPSAKGVALLNTTTFGNNINSKGYLMVKTTSDICLSIAKKVDAAATAVPTATDFSGLYKCVNGAVTDSSKAVVAPSTATDGTFYFGYKVKDVAATTTTTTTNP